ncbi:MAG: ribosome-associated translation inhibitor RaiA [Desulfuromonadales bacterium]|nr:ribosome-associated translation inhibitor RaiA [Desulfuromonadales bacterium]
MNVITTFRHIDPSDALKSYVEEKLERVKKYVDEPITAQAYLTVEKIRHIAEITIGAKGVTIKASEASNDMYASIDVVIDKIERQLRRYKERIKAHNPAEVLKSRKGKKTVVQAESLEQQKEPVIIRSEPIIIKPMSVDEAVMQMDLMHKDFFVFTDAASEEINVIYRRKDGNYGLIEPARS